MTSAFQPAPIPDGRVDVDGQPHLRDGRGGLVPVALVKPQHQLQDELVRKIMGYAVALSDQVARFKGHTCDDLAAFEALLAQEYGAKVGGPKGNKSLMSYDGLMKVTVQVADYVSFGPELQVAKDLVDECINDWATGARDELRALVTHAFKTDKAGQVSVAQIYTLLRLEIEDPRWLRGMQAIRDAMRVVGSKSYVRCYRRETFDGPWQAVTIDLAKA
jgi:hypothetical protein